jgi:hypothetical protein
MLACSNMSRIVWRERRDVVVKSIVFSNLLFEQHPKDQRGASHFWLLPTFRPAGGPIAIAGKGRASTMRCG